MCVHWYRKHTYEEFLQVLHLARDTEVCDDLHLCKTVSTFPATAQTVYAVCVREPSCFGLTPLPEQPLHGPLPLRRGDTEL